MISEVANCFERDIRSQNPGNYACVVEDFYLTRAGNHVDRVIKNEEICSILKTDLILVRPPSVAVE